MKKKLRKHTGKIKMNFKKFVIKKRDKKGTLIQKKQQERAIQN